MKVKGSNLLTLVNFNEKRRNARCFSHNFIQLLLILFYKVRYVFENMYKKQKQGYTSLAITDKDVLYGAPEFYRICVEEGVQPIIGLHLSYTYEEKIMACLRTQKMK